MAFNEHNALRLLDRIVASMYQSIAPIMRMDSEIILPVTINYDDRSSFNYHDLQPQMSISWFDLDNPVSIGHELMHCLHYIQKKEIFFDDSREAQNLAEMVAIYGEKFFQQKSKNLKSLLKAMKSITRNSFAEDDDIELDEEYYRDYEGAERAASFVHLNYGFKYLRKFSLANIQTAERLLRRLGHDCPLFVDYGTSNDWDLIRLSDKSVHESRLVLGEINLTIPCIYRG
jgi:hypothetical protein